MSSNNRKGKSSAAMQGVGVSDDDFTATVREEARYCGIVKLKIISNKGDTFVKLKLISGMRESEAY